ncbi:MAG: lipase [Planctomycetota bacterium]
MNDHAVVFGDYQHLSGIVHRHEDCSRDVAVVSLTAGMLPSSGPFRLHVELARSLGKCNLASLRFDLSGIGESLGVGVSGRSIDRAASETRQAVDFLAQVHGFEKFILFGLCSGADDSIHAAMMDDRVIGVVAMDGCGYRTPRFYAHRILGHYLPLAMRPRKWRRLVRRKLGWETPPPRSLQQGDDVREFPTRRQAVQELDQLSQRGVQLHFVYTGGVHDYFNHASQFRGMFPELCDDTRITSHFFPRMDHVASLCEDRLRLIEHVTGRITHMASDTVPTY